MSDIRVDYDTALTLLEKAVADMGGEYVYPKSGTDDPQVDCAYFDAMTGQPDCILGHALSYLGIGFSDVENFNEGHAISVLVNNGVVNLDDKAERLWQTAQSVQDKGATWESALAQARVVAEGLPADYFAANDAL